MRDERPPARIPVLADQTGRSIAAALHARRLRRLKMKLILAAVALIALAAPVFAQAAGAPGANPSSMTTAEGAGVVTAVDAKGGTVTIHHGPIAKLAWPAMTMAFKATPPSLLLGVKVGEPVTFALMQMGGATTLTAIKPK